MSDFKANMHQIPLPALPQRLQRFPRPLAVYKGPTSKGREGKGRGRERRVAPQLGSLDPPVSKSNKN